MKIRMSLQIFKEKRIDQKQKIRNQNGCELLKARKFIFHLDLHSGKLLGKLRAGESWINAHILKHCTSYVTFL